MKHDQLMKKKQVPKEQPAGLSIENFKILRVLGEGTYAEVYEAQHLGKNRRVVLKKIFKDQIVKQEKEKEVYMERFVLIKYGSKHPGMIKFFGSFQDNQYLYFIMEHCPYGDFGFFIKQLKAIRKETSAEGILLLIKMYIYQIVLILNFLHENGIAHLDLKVNQFDQTYTKPQNLVIDSELNLKIVDFGTSYFFEQQKIDPQNLEFIYQQNQKMKEQKKSTNLDNEETNINSPQRSSSFVGTVEYLSPEMLENSCASKEADLWALGCIIYEIFYGRQPFHAETENIIFSNIITNNYKFGTQSLFPVSQDVKDLINNLLCPNPNDRLGSNNTLKILEHNFFDFVKELKYKPWVSQLQQCDEFSNVFISLRDKLTRNHMKNSIIYIQRESCLQKVQHDEQTTFSMQQLTTKLPHKIETQGLIKIEGNGLFCFSKVALMTANYENNTIEIDEMTKSAKPQHFKGKQIILEYDKIKQRYILMYQDKKIFFKDAETLSVNWIEVLIKLQNEN